MQEGGDAGRCALSRVQTFQRTQASKRQLGRAARVWHGAGWDGLAWNRQCEGLAK